MFYLNVSFSLAFAFNTVVAQEVELVYWSQSLIPTSSCRLFLGNKLNLEFLLFQWDAQTFALSFVDAKPG